MAFPHSDPSEDLSTGVIVPLRSLHDGKVRLADELDQDERRHLIESMAANVLSAAHDLPVVVVYDAPEVAEWAIAHGATPLAQVQPGLNAAVAEGYEHLSSSGCDRAIIAHADLPLATDLRKLCTRFPVAIAPDRHRGGTNVFALPTGLNISFAYGPDSFSKHRAICRSLGFEPHIIDDPNLGWDVDEPSDRAYDPPRPGLATLENPHAIDH